MKTNAGMSKRHLPFLPVNLFFLCIYSISNNKVGIGSTLNDSKEESNMLGINEKYYLNPHIEETHRDASNAVQQLVKAFEAAYGVDELYRRIAEEAVRNVRVQFNMSTNELISNVVSDFRKVLKTMQVNALIALTEKVGKYMHLTDVERCMAESIDETIYAYICDHLDDEDTIYANMKKVYDHFMVA